MAKVLEINRRFMKEVLEDIVNLFNGIADVNVYNMHEPDERYGATIDCYILESPISIFFNDDKKLEVKHTYMDTREFDLCEPDSLMFLKEHILSMLREEMEEEKSKSESEVKSYSEYIKLVDKLSLF